MSIILFPFITLSFCLLPSKYRHRQKKVLILRSVDLSCRQIRRQTCRLVFRRTSGKRIVKSALSRLSRRQGEPLIRVCRHSRRHRRQDRRRRFHRRSIRRKSEKWFSRRTERRTRRTGNGGGGHTGSWCADKAHVSLAAYWIRKVKINRLKT
jgi:hypothetical protein